MSKEGKSGEVTDQQLVARALDTLTEVLVDKKLEQVRGSIGALDAKLSERLSTQAKDQVQSIERMRQELSSRLDELKRKIDAADERHKTALAEADERGRKAQDEIKREVQDARSSAESRIRTAKAELDQALASKEESLKHELGALSVGLSSLQLELQEQLDKTQRISSLLQGVASAFTGQREAAASVAAAAAAGGAGENLDSALDNVFGGNAGDAAERDVQAGSSGGKKSR